MSQRDPQGHIIKTEDKEEIFAAYVDRLLAGETVDLEAIEREHGQLGKEIVEQLRLLGEMGVGDEDSNTAILDLPSEVGRYQVKQLIGEGGFGRVYLAFDPQLQRRVAIKVPKNDTLNPIHSELYLNEARALARLDHPHIVPIYDVGESDRFPCFIVSKFVDGSNLSQVLKHKHFSHQDAAELIATAADALDYAHKRGLVHRDIKPANILVENKSPQITDFGIALTEGELGSAKRFVGTPAYMSPEQARGEAHRVDGRSDVYSLGVVLYELLVGRPPFQVASSTKLMGLVAIAEPKPPRQLDESIPSELERVCLNAMAKRASERYSTAHDMACDLRSYLQVAQHSDLSSSDGAEFDTANSTHRSDKLTAAPPTPDSATYSTTIVPKGLRSFDRYDADFFLTLVPGARDRNGLPEIIRFWKHAIEESVDPFSVGLIYGPSGCGKSSLVKAGLLPQLSDRVVVIYIEATRKTTEDNLLHRLRKQFPDLPADLDLPRTMAASRRQLAQRGRKLLIVLDQFEQWLHSRVRGMLPEQLSLALRQCDGAHMQCVVTARDEFWMAITRFMQDLDIRLIEGWNSSPVDLFPMKHARKVLAAFGQAYGDLPDPNEATEEQIAFLTQAVNDLAEDGRVICVRLALFADMMKGKPWTPATLRSIGGAKGVGVAFLESTFCASSASRQCRIHQKAAQATLRVLVSEPDTEIKGSTKTYLELLDASGYQSTPHNFAELMVILDHKLRLLAPTELANENEANSQSPDHGHYQLTHDYLVPSLRAWLSQKQRETRRGRAERCLAECSRHWHVKTHDRHLPSLWEFANISFLTDAKSWNFRQQTMMSAARRFHMMRWGGALLLTLVVALAIQFMVISARREVQIDQVRTIVESLSSNRGILLPPLSGLDTYPSEIVVDELRSSFQTSEGFRQLPLAYALAHLGDVRIEFLLSNVKSVSPDEVDNLINAFNQAKTKSLNAIALKLGQAEKEQNWRLSARLAMIALLLGDDSAVCSLCELRADPIRRSWFIEECSTWHGNLSRLAKLVGGSLDPPLRSAIALAVGCEESKNVTAEDKRMWEEVLSNWYRNGPDGLTHSAAGWVLQHWDMRSILQSVATEEFTIPPKLQHRLETQTSDVRKTKTQLATLEASLETQRENWLEDLRNASPSDVGPPMDGLVAHVGFDLVDDIESTMSNPGAAQSPIDVSDNLDFETGVVGKALKLNGTGDQISLGNTFQPDRHDAFSFGGWFLTKSKEPMAIVAKIDAGAYYRGWDVLLHQGVVETHFKNEWPHKVIKVSAGQGLADGHWHHVSVTYDGSSRAAGVAVYLDGLPATPAVEYDTLTETIQNSVPLSIGRRSVGCWFDGLLDGIRVYDRQLSDSEAFQLVRAEIASLAKVPADRRTIEQNRLLRKYYVSQNKPRLELLAQLSEASSRLAEVNNEILRLRRQVPKPTRDWHINSVGITLLGIPKGNFDRISYPGYRGKGIRKSRKQRVRITTPFLIAEREVTRAQFEQFIDDPDYPDRKPQAWRGAQLRYSPTKQHPVQNVSWLDAVLFCNWMSWREGLKPSYAPTDSDESTWCRIEGANGYRLPTEAEWEYACRAGTATAYCFGNDKALLDRYTVFLSSQLQVAGSKLPNAWGLFDVHGNAWEWCDDWYDTYDDESSELVDPRGPVDGIKRVVRGESILHPPETVDLSRDGVAPHIRDRVYGFRVARSVP